MYQKQAERKWNATTTLLQRPQRNMYNIALSLTWLFLPMSLHYITKNRTVYPYYVHTIVKSLGSRHAWTDRKTQHYTHMYVAMYTTAVQGLAYNHYYDFY